MLGFQQCCFNILHFLSVLGITCLSKIYAGTFGQVLECLDNEKEEIVAIKVVRSINKYREAARTEIEVLLRLARHDVDGAQ